MRNPHKIRFPLAICVRLTRTTDKEEWEVRNSSAMGCVDECSEVVKIFTPTEEKDHTAIPRGDIKVVKEGVSF